MGVIQHSHKYYSASILKSQNPVALGDCQEVCVNSSFSQIDFLIIYLNFPH